MKISRAILAGWMVTWLLFSSLLSASPTLHGYFHENASEPTHQCAVTLLEQQQLLTGEPNVVVVVQEFSQSELTLPTTTVLTSQDAAGFLPSRGPPVLS